MKILRPLYNYATNSVELKLRDSLRLPVTLSDGDVPVLICKRGLESSVQLFSCNGSVLDSTSGHVLFLIDAEDMQHDSGPVFLEVRVRGNGKESVEGQFESFITQSLTIPSFHNPDYSPRYNTHIIITGDVLETMTDQSILDNFDLIIVDPQSYYYLKEEYRSKAILKFNIWASDRYEPDPFQVYENFMPTPSEIGGPEVQNEEGLYLYPMSTSWRLNFYVHIHDFLRDHVNQIAGVMFEDFYPDMGTQWFLENGDDLLVWPDRTDVEGDLVPNFFASELQVLEIGTRTFLDSYLGSSSILIVGGTVRQLSTTRRLSENAGSFGPTGHEEIIDRLEDDGVAYPEYYVKEGDLVQVNPYDSTGVFSQWTDNDYGHGGVNFARASYLVATRGGSLGVAYGEVPLTGKTVYSLFVDPNLPRWYHY